MNNVELYTDDLFIRQWYHISGMLSLTETSPLYVGEERDNERKSRGQ
jgi:hypothetical protein